ncbi:MAG TPA: EamA family transporter [Gemmatimonadales bacterium]|jgi:drug/metabolite transporter (DMT)-like permease
MSEHRGRLILAFIAVYLVWGSTYLGIRIAIETMPPFLMAGMRFLVAGTVLYVVARLRGAPTPTRPQWIACAIVGALLLLGGNGGVAWGELVVPSSLAALLVATEPLWIAILDWLRPGGQRPTAFVAVGLLIGFAGVAVLVSPGHLVGGTAINPIGAMVILGASVSWAIGSLYAARGANLPASPLLATGAQMLIGSLMFGIASLASGEFSRFSVGAVSARSWWALVYLILIGALIGFSAYTYMLKNASPAKTSTYAYVNPVVAVFLGWAFAGEAITPRTLLAAATIVGAVVVITSAKSRAFERARGAIRGAGRRLTGSGERSA